MTNPILKKELHKLFLFLVFKFLSFVSYDLCIWDLPALAYTHHYHVLHDMSKSTLSVLY